MKNNNLLKVLVMPFILGSLFACNASNNNDKPNDEVPIIVPDEEIDDHNDANPDLEAPVFKYYVTGYEWGPAVDKVVIEFPDAVTTIPENAFTVRNGTTNVSVLKQYACNIKGEEVEDESRYLALSFQVKNGYLSPFTYSMTTSKNTWSTNFNLTITQAKGTKISTYTDDYEGLTFGGIMNENNRYCVATANLYKDKFTYTDTGPSPVKRTIQRAAFEPKSYKKDGGKNPLVIWLHGAGEGGTDVDITLLGNDITNLFEDRIQDHFRTDKLKGAYVLALQSPTFWMDNGNGANHAGDQDSVYTEIVMEAIKDYVKYNGDIDENRIYLGGCSNGGYMTINMLINYPEYFAAAYPICEAYQDSFVDAGKLEKLTKQNIWFTTSANDTTVNPSNFTCATYARLMQEDAENVYFSYFSSIVGEDDPSGYLMGHFSWVYTLEDRCTKVQARETDKTKLVGSNDGGGTIEVKINGEVVTLWGWMANQSL